MGLINTIFVYLASLFAITILAASFIGINNLLKKRDHIDTQLLQYEAKNSDIYEIAYLIGREQEVFQLSICTLIKNNFLISCNENYIVNESKLSVTETLSKIEKKIFDVLVSRQDRIDLKQFSESKEVDSFFKSLNPVFNSYKKKFRKLKLINQFYPVASAIYIFTFGLLTVFHIFLVFYMKEFYLYIICLPVVAIVNLVYFFILMFFLSKNIEEFTENTMPYIGMYEQLHSAYPNVAKEYEVYTSTIATNI